MIVIFLTLCPLLINAQDEVKISLLHPTAIWIPEEKKALCLEIRCSNSATIWGRLLILDPNTKTFNFVNIPNFSLFPLLNILPYFRNSKEILLLGSEPKKYDLQLIGITPFSTPPIIRTILYLNGEASTLFPRDIKIFRKYLILLAEFRKPKSPRFYRRCASLVMFNIDAKTSRTLRSDIRSENLVCTPGGNLYFLSEKGIQRITGDIANVELIVDSKDIAGLTVKESPISWLNSAKYSSTLSRQTEWELSYLFDHMELYISPDENIGIIKMYELSNKPAQLYSFDLRKRKFNNSIKVACNSIVFAPNSKKILIASTNGIELYDTSLRKISTLINSSGKIVSCGELGFILIKKRTEKDTPACSTGLYPYEFLMYNWEGKFLFKFEPV